MSRAHHICQPECIVVRVCAARLVTAIGLRLYWILSSSTSGSQVILHCSIANLTPLLARSSQCLRRNGRTRQPTALTHRVGSGSAPRCLASWKSTADSIQGEPESSGIDDPFGNAIRGGYGGAGPLEQLPGEIDMSGFNTGWTSAPNMAYPSAYQSPELNLALHDHLL